MRARELLDEDYSRNLHTDLDNLLIAAKGAGASELETASLVSSLQSMGYAVDTNSILVVLNQDPSVESATPEMVNFVQPETTEPGNIQNPTTDSADKVKDMASKATKIG